MINLLLIILGVWILTSILLGFTFGQLINIGKRVDAENKKLLKRIGKVNE